MKLQPNVSESDDIEKALEIKMGGLAGGVGDSILVFWRQGRDSGDRAPSDRLCHLSLNFLKDIRSKIQKS